MSKLNSLKSLARPTILKLDGGFTLIELLVVIFILGILSSMALPSLFRQVAKAREADGKNQIGAISRSQQIYHFETKTFADSVASLLGTANLQSNYYTFPDPSIASDTIVKHQAIAINPETDQVRNYALGVYQNNGNFSVALCQGAGANVDVDVPTIITDDCTNGGIRIK